MELNGHYRNIQPYSEPYQLSNFLVFFKSEFLGTSTLFLTISFFYCAQSLSILTHHRLIK